MALGASRSPSGSPKPIVIPIAGYAGHRKGEVAENLFGKCFRDISIKSKIIERQENRRNPFNIQRKKAASTLDVSSVENSSDNFNQS